MKYTKRNGFETGNLHRNWAMGCLLDMQDEELLNRAYKVIDALWRGDDKSLTAIRLKEIKERMARKENANENQSVRNRKCQAG